MLKIIVATEMCGLETTNLVMVLDVDNENIDIEQAVKNACKEYCLTNDGKETLEENNGYFNWGDFDTHVPNDICKKYGFTKVASNVSEVFNFNQQLVDEDTLN